jgi:hypothetical protein
LTADPTVISVACEPAGEGFLCHVTVGDDFDATYHEVSVSDVDLAAYAVGSQDPRTLVHESFLFLLERERRESILARFDLPVISRYFPEFGIQIRRRLATGIR